MEEFLEVLRSEGFEPAEVIPDGQIHRFAADNDDKRKSAFYILYRNYLQSSGTEYYFAIYGSWKYGEPQKWCSLGKKVPRAQAAEHKEQLRRAKEAADKAREESFKEVASEVEAFWSGLYETGTSDYLQRKQISGALGVRYSGGSVYVPCRDAEGKLWSLEEIRADGRKMSWTGGRKAGCFHCLGTIGDGETKVYLAEGFATAASIFRSTGCPTICCFGSGQFEVIGRALKHKYPRASLVIAGDLDKLGKTGGEERAEKAAKQLSAALVFPSFRNRGDGDTDFNDLHQAEGIEAVRSQLSSSLVPVQLSAGEISEVPFPDEAHNGRRLGTIENVRELLRRLAITVRYNGISKKQEISIPNESFSLDNRDNCTFAHVISWCERCSIPTSKVDQYLTVLADKNLYNPVADWIQGAAWDGKSRLNEFYATVSSENEPLKEKLMRRWLISAVAAAFEPRGIAASGMLVFQGLQYAGKSRWFKRLCPEDLRRDGLELSPSDKDSVTRATEVWLGELGELDGTFRRADIAALKAFITRDRDILRVPFARRNSEFVRRTVYFGSVNEMQYLQDATGNRRFWTVGCTGINPDHNVDMQQLFAEVLTFYRAGEQWWLTREEHEELAASNATFESVEPIEERIRDWYGWGKPATEVIPYPMSATAVCMEIGYPNPNKHDTNAAARALRKFGCKPDRLKRYWVPKPKDISMPHYQQRVPD